MTGPYLVFDVGPTLEDAHGGTFGLEVSSVFQVIEPGTIAAVPLAPAVVLGILNHHGRVVTVVDPAPLLGLTAQPRPAAQVVILRQGVRGPFNLGLQAARIHGIVPEGELSPVSVQARPCVRWVAQAGRRLIHIVELTPLLEKLSRLFGDTREAVQGVGT